MGGVYFDIATIAARVSIYECVNVSKQYVQIQRPLHLLNSHRLLSLSVLRL